MRALALTLLATLALALPAAATEDRAEYIDGLTEAIVAGDESAMAEMYAVSTDVTISPECQRYADISLMAFGLIAYAASYPQSWSVQVLFEYVIDALPTFRNDCVLAI